MKICDIFQTLSVRETYLSQNRSGNHNTGAELKISFIAPDATEPALGFSLTAAISTRRQLEPQHRRGVLPI